jgi:hypothetical protein
MIYTIRRVVSLETYAGAEPEEGYTGLIPPENQSGRVPAVECFHILISQAGERDQVDRAFIVKKG